jgi:hypothetical protein
MKAKFFYGLLIVVLSTVFSSCTDVAHQSTAQKMGQKQEAMLAEADRQAGMPAIVNYQERKLAKLILELRDQENLICYAYIVPELTGKPVFLGKCIGYGLPYATQFTAPESIQRFDHSGGYSWERLPQADPNGLFMPASAEGTWVMLIDPKTNEPHPVYCEPRILISPFMLPKE